MPSRTPTNVVVRAFTLVELVVVIGVIAVLIAFLIPALQKARDAADMVRCTSNLRQLHTGLLMYAGENQGWIFPPVYGINTALPAGQFLRLGGFPSWANMLYGEATTRWKPPKSYATNREAMYCPTQTPREPSGGSLRGSYGLNKRMGTAATGPTFTVVEPGFINCYYNLLRTRSPSEMYLMIDTTRSGLLATSGGNAEWIYGNEDFRHRNKANVLFHDGHVAALRKKLISEPTAYGKEGVLVPDQETVPAAYPWRCQ